MKLTLGKKLGLGFGVILALMVFSAALSYVKLADVKLNQDLAFDVRFPSQEAARVLQRDLNQAGNKFVSMGVIPGEGQYALDVELTEELSGMRLSDIHQSYEVDRATSRLVKREHAITE